MSHSRRSLRRAHMGTRYCRLPCSMPHHRSPCCRLDLQRRAVVSFWILDWTEPTSRSQIRCTWNKCDYLRPTSINCAMVLLLSASRESNNNERYMERTNEGLNVSVSYGMNRTAGLVAVVIGIIAGDADVCRRRAVVDAAGPEKSIMACALKVSVWDRTVAGIHLLTHMKHAEAALPAIGTLDCKHHAKLIYMRARLSSKSHCRRRDPWLDRSCTTRCSTCRCRSPSCHRDLQSQAASSRLKLHGQPILCADEQRRQR